MNPSPAETFLAQLDPEIDEKFKSLAQQINKTGKLTPKDKAIISVACAVALRCKDCVKKHEQLARDMGVSQEELMEAAAVASLIRMGSGLNTAANLLNTPE